MREKGFGHAGRPPMAGTSLGGGSTAVIGTRWASLLTEKWYSSSVSSSGPCTEIIDPSLSQGDCYGSIEGCQV